MHQTTHPAPPLHWRPIAGDLHQAAPLPALPAAVRLRRPPELHQECTMPRPTPAGSPPAVRLADRCRPAPACRSAPAPALALRPLTARHAACKWRVAIVATASRLPGYAVPNGTTPAACAPGFLSPATACPPARHRFATAPLMANPAIRGLRLAAGYRVPAWAARAPASARSKASLGASKLHNEELSAACRLSGSRPDNFRYAKCRPIVTRPRPPWLSGCAGSHCVARFRLARLPPVRPPEVAPQKSALARRRTVDKSAFFALVAP
jgi:hypothetical protein